MEANANRPAPSRQLLLAMAIAYSRWNTHQRRTLLLVAFHSISRIEDLVPRCWNRVAKARDAVRELEKAGHLLRDGGRIQIIESSFAPPEFYPPQQMALVEEPLANATLAEVSRLESPDGTACPTPDGMGRPSWDGQGSLSGVGRDVNTGMIGPSPPAGAGRARSIDLDRSKDRSRSIDRAALGQDCHQEAVFERLAKIPHLRWLREELLRRKTTTARRFWLLYEKNSLRAAQLIQEAATKSKPAAFLNTVLARETIA